MALTLEQAQAAVAAAEKAVEEAKGKGVSAAIAASKALSAAKNNLQAAEAGVDPTGKSRQQVISEMTKARVVEERKAAAAADPMRNPTERPEAPPSDGQNIFYYGWIGDSWRLYKQPIATGTEGQIASASARAEGGPTKATFESSVGANSLKSSAAATVTPVVTSTDTVTSTATSTVTVTPTVTSTVTVTPTATVTPVVTSTVTVTPTVTTSPSVMTSGQQDVYSIMLGRLNQYNLGALAPLIRKLAIEGATESTIMLQLSEEPLYKERFKANETRKQKGLSVLTPSQYLSLEDDYRQVLRAYGLTQFDNDAYVSQFLANDVSVSELSNRVVTAVQRVRNADPAVSNMLKNLYGIGQNDLVAYVLDPQQQFQKIERQVAASEISVAAARQGFNIGATVAEQLAAQGISQAEAQKGYATIADILPTAEKLSDIYGGQLESYRLAEGEQEVFNQLASAQRKRRALTERELASFSGQAGLGRTSLTQQTGGQF